MGRFNNICWTLSYSEDDDAVPPGCSTTRDALPSSAQGIGGGK